MTLNRNLTMSPSFGHIAMIFAGGALALSALTVANAATCVVPTDYSTIQDAVADTSCTTINVVATGHYSGPVTIDRPLTLNGVETGIDARTRDAVNHQGESIIIGNPAITITAPDVVVNGFTIESPSPVDGSVSGLTIKATGNGAVITNNIFDQIVSDGSTAQAVAMYRGPDGVEISHNVIENVSGQASSKGVFIEDSVSTDPSTGLVVNGNLIANISSTDKGAYGVMINNGSDNGSAPTRNFGLVIANNTIKGLSGGGWVHAVGIEADAPNAIVTGNAFSDLSAPGSDVVAVWFESEDNSYASSKVNDNNFDFGTRSSVYGIAVDSSFYGSASHGPLDGTCNYWGNASGPGRGSASQGSGNGALVSPLVTFAPWSKNPAPQGPCVPMPGSSSKTPNGPPNSAPVGLHHNPGPPPGR